MAAAGGASVTSAAVACPLRTTCFAPPRASLGISTLPRCEPSDLGLKITWKEQLEPASSLALAQLLVDGSREKFCASTLCARSTLPITSRPVPVLVTVTPCGELSLERLVGSKLTCVR